LRIAEQLFSAMRRERNRASAAQRTSTPTATWIAWSTISFSPPIVKQHPRSRPDPSPVVPTSMSCTRRRLSAAARRISPFQTRLPPSITTSPGSSTRMAPGVIFRRAASARSREVSRARAQALPVRQRAQLLAERRPLDPCLPGRRAMLATIRPQFDDAYLHCASLRPHPSPARSQEGGNAAPTATPGALTSVSRSPKRRVCAEQVGRHIQSRCASARLYHSRVRRIASAFDRRVRSDRRRAPIVAKRHGAHRRCSITALEPISPFGGRCSMPAADRQVRKAQTLGMASGGRGKAPAGRRDRRPGIGRRTGALGRGWSQLLEDGFTGGLYFCAGAYTPVGFVRSPNSSDRFCISGQQGI
jgi:hypothetical protein